MGKIQYGRLAIPGALIVLLVYLIWQSSWNFVYLGGLLFLLCILLYFYYYRGKIQDLNNQPVRDLWGTAWGIGTLRPPRLLPTSPECPCLAKGETLSH